MPDSEKNELNTAHLGLSVHDLHKNFGGQAALRGVTFTAAHREIISLLGPSGCGKSTVLAIIAGLEQPDQGAVLWDGVSLADKPTYQRSFGLMFQDFALFPHMNVYQNIAFGLKMKKESDAIVKQRVTEVLETVGLEGYEKRDVNTLSGGEAQRVALARSLAPNPKLLMLDEPLGSLDRTLRERLMVDLRQILRANHLTAIYVTHDQEEAFSVADRTVLMNAGQVVQIGTPQEIYRKPINSFAAHFLGLENLISGQIQIENGSVQVRTFLGTFPLHHRPDLPEKVIILVRPDAVYLGEEHPVKLRGQVRQVAFRGSNNRLVVEIGGQSLSFDLHASADTPREGDQIVMSFNPADAIQLFTE